MNRAPKESRAPEARRSRWRGLARRLPKLGTMDVRGLQCCICGREGSWAEMFGMSLFPAEEVEAFQQWFVHPSCIHDVMLPEARDTATRDEIQSMWRSE